MRRAVFLDKDGTLVEDVPYNVDADRVRLANGVPEGLRALQEAGFEFVCVSNQSGIARGYFEPEALDPVWKKLRTMLAREGVRLRAWYYCPHHPDGVVERWSVDCECRKPKPGLLRIAAEELGIDLGRSWMVGDILHDVEAGHRAGCRSVLIDNGNETEWFSGPGRVADAVVADMAEAARCILAAPAREEAVAWG